MSAFTGFAATAVGTLFLLAILSPAKAENFEVKSGSKICVGTVCDNSNAFYYFDCCGTILNDCCFHFQTWVLLVLIVLGVLALLSVVGGFIKFICCCDR
uniref:Transmembrane protein n=1 Tax=Panagrellus redivivus TaxID=6233 RepID=A0A7E4ZVQ2_PANRE